MASGWPLERSSPPRPTRRSRHEVRGKHCTLLRGGARPLDHVPAPAEAPGLLCSGAEDGRISLWAVSDAGATWPARSPRARAARAARRPTSVYALAVSPATGDILLAGGADYRVHMYDLRSRACCIRSPAMRAPCAPSASRQTEQAVQPAATSTSLCGACRAAPTMAAPPPAAPPPTRTAATPNAPAPPATELIAIEVGWFPPFDRTCVDGWLDPHFYCVLVAHRKNLYAVYVGRGTAPFDRLNRRKPSTTGTHVWV